MFLFFCLIVSFLERMTLHLGNTRGNTRAECPKCHDDQNSSQTLSSSLSTDEMRRGNLGAQWEHNHPLSHWYISIWQSKPFLKNTAQVRNMWEHMLTMALSKMILPGLHTNMTQVTHLNYVWNRKDFQECVKSITAFVCLSSHLVQVSSPMLYRSNNQLNEANTERMTKVWGNTSVTSTAPTCPPAHPPPCHPHIHTRHQDTKLTLMTHNRNSSTRAAAAPLNSRCCFYFWACLVFLPY